MNTIIIQVQLPATIYPTLTVLKSDWERAKVLLASGKKPIITGGIGGCGCHGESINGGLDQVTLLSGPDEYGTYEATSEAWEFFGTIKLHDPMATHL